MFPCQNPQTCEFGAHSGPDGEVVQCDKPAVGYGGFKGANAWAGYACADCAAAAESEGFRIWDPIQAPGVIEPPNIH